MKNSKFKIQNSLLLLTLGILIAGNLSAQKDENRFGELQIPSFDHEMSNKNAAFVENRGQLGVFGQPGVVASSVQYYSNQPDFFDFVSEEAISFVSALPADTLGVLYDVNRLDLIFFDEVLRKKVPLRPIPFLQGNPLRHFYTGLTTAGIENVREFNELFFRQLYSGVDMSLTHNRKGLKALFRVQPGVDPATIKMQFDGLTALNFTNGKLNLGSYQSTYQFNQPVAYQIDNSNNIISLPVTFSVDGNGRVFFLVPSFDPATALYITVKQGNDPITAKTKDDNMEWSSYIGEAGPTTLYSVKTDDLGNVLYAGKASHPNFASGFGFFPIVNYSDGGDGFLVKFNENIEPQWYTFIGGDLPTASNLPALDRAISIGIRGDNEIVMTGTSASTNLPQVSSTGSGYSGDSNPGTGDPDCGDCMDIFYARFNSSGILQYSTYFGGDSYEIPTEIISKGNGIYIVGERHPTTPLFAQAGATNSSDGTGLILKFDNGNNLVWSTSLNADRIMAATSNESSQLILGGYVDNNKTLPSANPSTNADFNTHNGGQFDGFIAVFNANDVLTHTAFYGGECEDIITDLATDVSTNTTYGIGATFSFPGSPCTQAGSDDIPIIANGFTRGQFGFLDHVYFKFSIPQPNTPINYTLSGYFGGGGEEFNNFENLDIKYTRPTVTVLKNGEFAISGMSNSGNDALGAKLPFPSSNPINWFSVQNNNTINTLLGKEAYIAIFDNTNKLRYTTFFGNGIFTEGPAEITYTNVNNKNRLFFAGNTQTLNLPSTPANERLTVEEYDETLGSLDYFRDFGPTNQIGLNEAAWGALFTLDGLYATLSVGEELEKSSVSLFPNPARTHIFVEAPENIKNVGIYSMEGKLVKQVDFEGQTVVEVNIEHLASGMYSVQTKTSVGSMNTKLLKL